MSRLVAYLGRPTPVAPLIFGGNHSLYHQSWEPKELLGGPARADGYGLVWYQDNRPRRLAEPRPIWNDEGLKATLGALSSGCVMGALRRRKQGDPGDRSGLTPLIHGQWTFTFDGQVPDFRRRHMRALRSSLPDALYGELRGSSESETLFLLVVAALQNGASPVQALCAAAGAVSSRVGRDEAQLAMALADGTSVVALLTSTVTRTNSLYVARGPAQAPNGIVLASEALDDGPSWERVPSHRAVVLGPDGRLEVPALGQFGH